MHFEVTTVWLQSSQPLVFLTHHAGVFVSRPLVPFTVIIHRVIIQVFQNYKAPAWVPEGTFFVPLFPSMLEAEEQQLFLFEYLFMGSAFSGNSLAAKLHVSHFTVVTVWNTSLWVTGDMLRVVWKYHRSVSYVDWGGFLCWNWIYKSWIPT